MNGQATPSHLLPGHVMVRSPKGSGKTTRLRQLLIDAKSILLIGHRRALIRHTCERLGLHCYLDDWPEPDMVRHPRYGICLDSLTKIPAKASFDVVVLDELEQVLAHFLAETMDRGGGAGTVFSLNFGAWSKKPRRSSPWMLTLDGSRSERYRA